MNLIILFTTILLFIVSCQPSSNQEPTAQSKLTTHDSLKVVQEVLGVVDDYTLAHNDLDDAKSAECFVNSPELVVAENSELTPNWEVLAKQIKEFHSTVATSQLSWENKKVLVLSLNSAAMTGRFSFNALLKDKKKISLSGYVTIVLVKHNNQWKFYQYHESYKVVNN